MKLATEVWKSDQNQEEIHPGERNEYVLGYNPKIISTEEIETFLDDKGFHFDRPE